MDGQILKKARKVLGLNQEEMAAKIYVSFPTYNGYENGKNIPKNKHAVINAVLLEASDKESEIINDEIFKKDSKDILLDILLELKALREENTEMKNLLNEVASYNTTELKLSQFSSSQLDILKQVLQNMSVQLQELKKADLKSASTK